MVNKNASVKKSNPATLMAATVVLTHEQKMVIFKGAYVKLKMDKLSPAAIEKHQVPDGTLRLESRIQCVCCGEEMKLEWIDLHLNQKHEMNFNEYVEILVNDDGSLKEVEVPVPAQKNLTLDQERLQNAVNKFKFK